MIFNKPDGEHLLNVTNVESYFKNRSNNIFQEHSELLRKHQEFFLNNSICKWNCTWKGNDIWKYDYTLQITKLVGTIFFKNQNMVKISPLEIFTLFPYL